MKITRPARYVLAALVALFITHFSVAAQMTFEADDTAGTLDLLRAGKPLLRHMAAYDTSTPERRLETYKVYTHVFDPAGEAVITKGPGGKFPHHRGIFVGWNRLRRGEESYDLWHMSKNCAQVHRKVLTQKVEGGTATLSTLVDWLDSEGVALLSEQRTFVIHADENAHLLMDVSCRLTAGEADLQLGGDPEHAGMQYRPHNDVVQNKSAKYLFPTDEADPTRDVDLPWAVLTYTLGEAEYTVQHMNHPGNPKGTKYSAYRDYGRFGAFPAFKIPAGETVTLRYGIRITTGSAPARDQLEACRQAFVDR